MLLSGDGELPSSAPGLRGPVPLGRSLGRVRRAGGTPSHNGGLGAGVSGQLRAAGHVEPHGAELFTAVASGGSRAPAVLRVGADLQTAAVPEEELVRPEAGEITVCPGRLQGQKSTTSAGGLSEPL